VLHLRLSASPPARCTVVVDGVISLSCPRKNAWGRSSSVNEADLTTTDAELTVHMQSGDDLVFLGSAVKVERTPLA